MRWPEAAFASAGKTSSRGGVDRGAVDRESPPEDERLRGKSGTCGRSRGSDESFPDSARRSGNRRRGPRLEPADETAEGAGRSRGSPRKRANVLGHGAGILQVD